MIEVKDLTFSYGKGLRGKDKQALRGLNFTVGDGEIFGFLGPNGSGKSTTQKILTGILKGHGGMVSVFGKDLRSVHTREFYQKIGVLFEFPYLYANLSALDNLHYFSSFYPKEQLRDAEELLDELEFKKDFRRKPVSSYSKGMRQRVSMARALISSPKLLFLDEPTNDLDIETLMILEDYLERYYVEDVEKEKIDDMLYTGMMAGVGDQYTYYMTADSLNRYMDDSNGRFGGIGIEVSLTRDGETVIGRVNEGGPAERAGILSGDIIIGVDGEDMRGRTREDIVIRTRGDIGKPVKVKVYRESDNSTPEFEMVREEIVVRSVESRMLEDGMGYILITGFKEKYL